MCSRSIVLIVVIGLSGAAASADYTHNIMLTGYWPPTNEMIRSFSTNPVQNPDGWIGQNWEGRGYDIYSYFPEFTHGLGKGEGDFEVDYQDTSADWWNITAQLKPVAIICFGRADDDYDWELEGGNRMYTLSQWDADYLAPLRPTADLPIASETAGTKRYSSLPMTDIVDAVNAEVPNLYAYQTALDTSKFLCNFIGYHANWYQDLHSDPSDPAWTVSAGLIHVGSRMDLADGVHATEVTLRTLTTYVDSVVPEPSAAMLVGLGGLALARRRGGC
jgi:hypothetical protein